MFNLSKRKKLDELPDSDQILLGGRIKFYLSIFQMVARGPENKHASKELYPCKAFQLALT